MQLSRTLVLAEQSEAEQLVKILSALTSTDEPTWVGHLRRDGSRTVGVTVPVGGIAIDVRVGRPAAPAVFELATDRDLAEVRDRLADTVGSAVSWPDDSDAPIEWAAVHIGEAITVKVVPARMGAAVVNNIREVDVVSSHAEQLAEALGAVFDVDVNERGEDDARRWEVGPFTLWPLLVGASEPPVTVTVSGPPGALDRARAAGLTVTTGPVRLINFGGISLHVHEIGRLAESEEQL